MIALRKVTIIPLLINISFLLTLIILSPNTAQAKMYKWVDDQGKIHFTDNKLNIPPKYRDKIKPEKEITKKPRTSGSRLEVTGTQNEFKLVSKGGKNITLKDFKVGYKNGGRARESNSVPYGVGTKFGFFFKLPLMEQGDKLLIDMEAQVPLRNRGGEREKIIFTFTFWNYAVPELKGNIHINFDEGDSEKYMVPGEWVITLYNNNKPFVSQKFRVYLP